MDLLDLRRQIDAVDDQLLQLFAQRMDLSAQVAAYKKEKNLPVLDTVREREKLHSIASRLPEDLQDAGISLYTLIFELSRSRQHALLERGTDLTDSIRRALDETPQLFPPKAAVACQGTEGSYSQQACEKLFRRANILYFDSFDSVFSAIEAGLCRYGMIPVENSTAGSVNQVYDLMMHRRFRIVRSVRLKVDHDLLALPGVKLSEIRTICSHEQALNQCSGFLAKHPEIELVRCANTAQAARMVAESGRRDMAALSSHRCAELYGLAPLAAACQDQTNNYTRFICISRDLEIYPGADRTSLMATLPHRPGALYRLLARFNARGINLTKLESRPLPGRDFEFMFYFDLEHSIYDPQFLPLLGELEEVCESFTYLGSYSEVL